MKDRKTRREAFAQFDGMGLETVRKLQAERRFDPYDREHAAEWLKLAEKQRADELAQETLRLAGSCDAAAWEAARQAKASAEEARKANAIAADAKDMARSSNNAAGWAAAAAVISAIVAFAAYLSTLAK